MHLLHMTECVFSKCSWKCWCFPYFYFNSNNHNDTDDLAEMTPGTRMLIKLAQKRHWSVIRKCWKWLASVVSKWRGSQRCISSNRRPPGFWLRSWSWFWFSGLTFFRISLIILAKWRPPGFWLWSWSWLLGSSFSKSLWQFWSPEKLHPSSRNGEHCVSMGICPHIIYV